MVEPTLLQSYVKIFTVVSLYWFVSITLVFVNKSLLSGATKLEAPLFVTFFQCVVTIVACYAIKAVSVKFPNKVNIFIVMYAVLTLTFSQGEIVNWL